MGCIVGQIQNIIQKLGEGVPQSNQEDMYTRFISQKKQPTPTPIRSTFLNTKIPQPHVLSLAWKAIRSDNLKDLAFLFDEECNSSLLAIQYDSQIGAQGTWWTIPMFCCRWNATKCLTFILKQLYNKGQDRYLACMDVINIQFNDILHIVCIFKAQQCFNILLKSGGTLVEVINSSGMTTSQVALRNGMLKMASILKGFKTSGQKRIPIVKDFLSQKMNANLNKGKIDDIINKRKKQIEQLKKDSEDEFNERTRDMQNRKKQLIDQENVKKRIMEQQQKLKKEAQQKKLRLLQQRQKAQKQFQQFKQKSRQNAQAQKRKLQQQISKKKRNMEELQKQAQKMQEQQKNKMKQQAMRLEQQAERMKQQAQKKEQEERRKYQQELIKQQQKLDQLNIQREQQMQNIKKRAQQAERVKKQKEEQIRRAQQQAKRYQKLLQEQRQKQQQKLLQAQRKQEQAIQRQKERLEQQMRKQQEQARQIKQKYERRIAQQQKKQEQIWGGIDVQNYTPQAKQKLKACLNKKILFTDQQFPPQPATLSKNALTPQMQKAIWIRPKEIFGSLDYKLYDKIDPNDILQGSLGVCYYLSTLSALAQKPQRVRKIFISPLNHLGMYLCRFYIDGKYTVVTIDDNIPVMPGSNQPLFTKSNGNQIWVMLLQKAWVKLFGSYTSAQGMSPDTMMQDLTGSPSYGYWSKQYNPNQLFNKFKEYDDKGYINVLTSKSQDKQGIVASHAYTCIAVYNVNGVKLFKVRNPWGSFQWNGKYGDQKNTWTQELKAAVNFKAQEDGIFFMTPEQLIECFSYFSIGFCRDNFKYNSIEFQSKKGQNKFFCFNMMKDGQISLRLAQKFKRLLHDPKYQYSSCQFETINYDQKKLVASGDKRVYWGHKTIHASDQVFMNLQKGKYIIRVKMNWVNPEKYNKGALVSFAEEEVAIQQYQYNQGYYLQLGFEAWMDIIKQQTKKGTQNVLKQQQFYMYSKWFKGFLAFYMVYHQGGAAQMFFEMKFKKELMQNCYMGYNTQGKCDVGKMMKPGSDFLFLIEKISIKGATNPGSYGVSLLDKQALQKKPK